MTLSVSIDRLVRNPLFLISTTALAVLLLCTHLLQDQQQALVELRTSHYGNALAALTANQSAEATLSQDLVSLQVTAADVATQADVKSVAIHDVENRILVQAGEARLHANHPDQQLRSFSSPILLGDSVAGYVSVDLDNQSVYEASNDTWLLGLTGLAAALMVLSLINQRSGTNTDVPASSDTTTVSTTPAVSGAEENQTRSSYTGSRPRHTVSLMLSSLNAEGLQQQLSSSLMDKLLDQLNANLNNISTLYQANLVTASPSQIRLELQGDDKSSTVFRAICAAKLLFQLQSDNDGGAQLKFTGVVRSKPSLHGLNNQLQWTKTCVEDIERLVQQTPRTLLLCSEDCTDQISQRIDGNKDNENLVQIKALQPSYQSLLDKQYRHLTQLTS